MAQATLRPWVVAAAALACIAVVLATPPRGHADVLTGCDPSLSQPFTPWLDFDSYFVAPGGRFEDAAAGWTLSGGASVVSGNEPWHVSALSDDHSLALPAGATASTGAICIGLVDPTIRLFARSTDFSGAATLVVRAHITVGALTVDVPVGSLLSDGSWQPTAPLPLLANLLAPLPADGTGSVVLTFSAVGGSWLVDDVYVDPFKTT